MNCQKQNQKWNMPKLASLFSGGVSSNTILRYVRARYPNMNGYIIHRMNYYIH